MLNAESQQADGKKTIESNIDQTPLILTLKIIGIAYLAKGRLHPIVLGWARDE